MLFLTKLKCAKLNITKTFSIFIINQTVAKRMNFYQLLKDTHCFVLVDAKILRNAL